MQLNQQNNESIICSSVTKVQGKDTLIALSTLNQLVIVDL